MPPIERRDCRPQFPLSALFLFVTACVHPASEAAKGQVSVQFGTRPATPFSTSAGQAAADAAINAYEAQPIPPLAMPVYPPNALAEHAGRVFRGVRIRVDTAGQVSAVDPSFATLSTPTPFAADFQAAIETALASWRFRPAEVERTESVVPADGGPPVVHKTVEKIEWTFDLSFVFSANGEVLSNVGARE